MVAYMVAQSDGASYGKVQTLRLSTQENTQGPSQVQARIKQDPEVSEQVRLWDVGGNRVIYGDLLVLPVEDSLLYAQPVYLQNEEASIPEFQKIVLVLGETIAWGGDFDEAARALLSERADDLEADGGAPAPDGGAKPAPDTGTGTDTGGDVPRPDAGTFSGMSQSELAASLTDIAAAYDRAQACQKDGDTVCYAREIERIEQLLAEARSEA
jgi:hypothetical protein